MLPLTAVAVILIFLYEGIPLIKKRLWRELYTLGCLLGIAVFISITRLFGLPSPLALLEKLFGPVGKIIFSST